MSSLALSTERDQTDSNSILLNGKRKERSGEEESVESWVKGKQKVLEEESEDDREKEKQKVLVEDEEAVENREEEEGELEIDPKYWMLSTNHDGETPLFSKKGENGGTNGGNDLSGSSRQKNSAKFPKFPPHPIRKEKESEKQQQQKMFKCEFCPKTFSNPSAFGGHQNAHRKERAELNRISEERPSAGFLELYEHLGIPPMCPSLAGSNNLGFSLQSNQPAAYFPRALDMLSYGLGNNAARRISAGSALLNPCFSSNGAVNTGSTNGARNDLFSNPHRPGFNGGTMSGLVQNGNGASQYQRSMGFNGGPMFGPGLPENGSNSFLKPHRLGSNGGSFSSAVAEAAGNGAFQFPWGASLSAGPGANSGILENRNNTNQNEKRVGLYGGVVSGTAENNRNGEFWGPSSPRGRNLNGGGLGNMLDRNVSGEGEARAPPDEDHADIDLTLKL